MIDIVKLPDDLNIDKRILNKMLEVYGTCPYCLNSALIERGYSEDWDLKYDSFGNKKKHVSYESSYICEKPLSKTGLFKKTYDWRKIMFHCYNCGMSWGSPEYPVLGDDKAANKAIFNAWKEGKNMEVNTLLIGVLDKDK